jgi:diguanylate cyclase (GGDEF)-like protein/PAS domain S-box-containing protein
VPSDRTEHSRAGRRLAVLRSLSRILSEPTDVSTTTPMLLETLCLELGWDVGTLWVIDPGAETLRSVGSWRHPRLAPRNYSGPLSGVRLPPGVGLPGRVWAQRSAQWGMDLDDAQRTSAMVGGLVSAVGFPIRSGDEIVGVVELQSSQHEPPDEDLVELLESAGALIAQTLQRDRALSLLREADVRYRALVEQIPAIVYVDVVDESMSTSYVSPQITSLLGVTPEEYIADPDCWYKHLHPEDKERALAEYLRGRDAGESFTFEYRLVANSGDVVWFRDSAVVISNEDGTPSFVHGVMLDITERKKAEEQVAFLAYHDKLTGLPNRAMFEELLDLAMARARRHELSVAVVYADLDNFKLVNDSLGHEAGDELLRQLADRLREATRETDLVARQGGDEFLLLLADLERDVVGPATSPTDGAMLVAETVANRIHDSLQLPFVLNGVECYASVSLGISLFPQDSTDLRGVLMNADTAMYQSKTMGPGGYVLYSEDTGDPMSRLSFSTRLRKAVESRHWVLHYQPVVDLARGDTVGVEALLRWQDPNGGLIPPGEFIPLAEEMGLIEVIGDWVIEEMCRQDAEWRRDGLSLEMSLNLSPRQLWQPEVVQKVMRPVEAFGADPSNMVLEITESTAMTDPERTYPAPALGVPREGLPRRARRLRDRVLLALTPEAPARRHPEDRPVVRPRRRPRFGGGEHGAHDHPAGGRPRHDAARRGRRDRAGVAVPLRSRLPPRPGLPLQPARSGFGDHRPVPPLGPPAPRRRRLSAAPTAPEPSHPELTGRRIFRRLGPSFHRVGSRETPVLGEAGVERGVLQ